jgi:hypothetical protein
MKVSSIFLLISLFAMMESSLTGFETKYCDDYYDKDLENRQAFSKGYCRSLSLENNLEAAQCCYVKYKKNDQTYYNCVPVTLAQYYDIDKAIDYFEDQHGWDIKSLECTSSSYLYGSFLLLLFILL